MTMPLIVLAVMSLFAGFWMAAQPGGSDRFARYLDPVFSRGEAHVLVARRQSRAVGCRGKRRRAHQPNRILVMILSVGRGWAGLYMALALLPNADKGYVEPIEAVSPPSTTRWMNKYTWTKATTYVFTGRRKLGSATRSHGLGEASYGSTRTSSTRVNAAGWLSV